MVLFAWDMASYLLAIVLATVGILNQRANDVSFSFIFHDLLSAIGNCWMEGRSSCLRSSRTRCPILARECLSFRLCVIQSFVRWGSQVRLVVNFLFEHLSRLARNGWRVRHFTVHLMADLLQVFHPLELVIDLIVHEFGELSADIVLRSALLLDHLGLEEDSFLFLPLTFLFGLFIPHFLLVARV